MSIEVEVEDVSEETQAYQAAEVRQFMKHPAWERCKAATRESIIRQWEAADNPLLREMCRHKLDGFKEFCNKLRAFGDGPSLTVSK